MHSHHSPRSSTAAIEAKLENKATLSQSASEPQFYYLKMDDGEFKDFRKTLPDEFKQISKLEAEKLLKENKGQFKREYVLDFAANATNSLFPVWLVKTGSSGFVLCASLLSGLPQEVLNKNPVLDNVSTVLVWVTSLLATAQWIFMYSPWTEATKATLHKATQAELAPLLERIENTLKTAWQHRDESTIKLLKFLAFQLLTKLINATAASTEIFFAPTGALWIPAILIIIFATRYCGQVWDNSVQEGVEFWLDNADQTSVYEQIKKGNVAIASKMVFEGLSATILKGLQYFFIAEGNQKLLGAWPSPILMLVCGIVHGLLVNYPTAFKNTLGPLKDLDRLLKEKLDSKIDAFLEEQIKLFMVLDHDQRINQLPSIIQKITTDLLLIDINLLDAKSADDLNSKLAKLVNPFIHLTADRKIERLEFKNQLMQLNIELLDSKVLQEGRFKLLTKDPLNALTILLNTVFGGYAGYKLLSPALSSIMPESASIPIATTAGAVVTGGFYYRSVSASECKKAALETLKPELDKKDSVSTKLNIASFSLATSGAFSSGLSAIGAAGSAVKNSTAGIAAVVFASTQKMINDIRYVKPYIYSTLKTQTSAVSDYFKSDEKWSFKTINNVRFWSPATKANNDAGNGVKSKLST